MPARSSVEEIHPRTETGETPLARTRRARRMLRLLAETHPDARCELNYGTPLELLVATILSAQTTDVRVNLVTPVLFSTYRSAHDYAAADRAELETMIVSTGFFRAKTNALIGLGQALVERYDGEVPRRFGDLVSLPGVGRKTANVVLVDAFGVPAIAVDTHVGRLARRFGWSSELDPDKVEADLSRIFPRSEWLLLSHRMIFHGRRVCHSRNPACGACSLARLCPTYGEGEVDPVKAAKLTKFPADDPVSGPRAGGSSP